MIPAIAPLATSHSRQSSVFVPTTTSTLRRGPCRDPFDRHARQDVAVEDGLPRHPAGRDRSSPAVRVRVGHQLAFQLVWAASRRSTPASAIASRVAGTPSLRPGTRRCAARPRRA